MLRGEVSLSKVKKFEQLTNVKQPSSAHLEARFGAMLTPNDVVDVALLHALDFSVVDFLITQDQGIHGRAKRCTPPLADRVLTVADAVAWLRAAFEPTKVVLPFVEELPAHAIDPTDDISDSLRQGYPDFDKWWCEKCVHDHRQCWVATIDGELAGVVVPKQETHAEAGTKYQGPKILKICTFKVNPKFRGEKLGELLLSKYCGLRPRFAGRPPAEAFCVPIRGEYHDVLFSELATRIQGDLFGMAATYGSNQAARTPGNTIRKVYLCRAPTTKLKPGSVLLFYRSLSPGYIASQSVTSVGVVEAVTNATSLEELVRFTAKRSVYREDQLEGFRAKAES
jgi:hypothetical protein